MLNKIYLEPGAKTTVMGGRFNYVSIAYYSISLRILDHYNREIDFFDNVAAGFRFGNPNDKIGRIEITNNSEYCQNVEIYSGALEVERKEKFVDNLYQKYYVVNVTAEYSYTGIINLSKKVLNVEVYSSENTSYHINLMENITGLSGVNIRNYVYSLNNIVSNDCSWCYGSHSDKYLLIGYEKRNIKLYNSYLNTQERCYLLPPEKSLLVVTGTVNTGMQINFKIKI